MHTKATTTVMATRGTVTIITTAVAIVPDMGAVNVKTSVVRAAVVGASVVGAAVVGVSDVEVAVV